MSRRHFIIACESEMLAATLDEAPGTVGLLIVTGGNETRAGAFCGQAALAQRIAAAGYPVLRFDRRGVGDSSGINTGFRSNAGDIAAALAAFRAQRPDLLRIVAFGNCDAASALMLGAGHGCNALVLANPWTIESEDVAPPPAALRARYVEKLSNPREVLRLLTGGVSLTKLKDGLVKALRPSLPPGSLAQDIARGLAPFSGPCAIVLAGRDRTAQAFSASWDKADPRLRHRPSADHAFSAADDRRWLEDQLISVLDEQARQFDVR